MTKFGEELRKFRQRSNDPYSPQGKLTQQRLGELMREDLGFTYSGAAVSDWERGVSKIHADQRSVLISIVKILNQRSGIKTLLDANQLLEAGNYRALNINEAQRVFTEIPDGFSDEPTTRHQKVSRSFISFLLADLFFMSEDELQELLAKSEEGPSPSWPRVLAAFMRKASGHISLTTVIWIWVWLIAWWLVTPSLRWPFDNRDVAAIAIGMYVAGSLVVPFLIGALVNTRDNDYWKQQASANSFLVRLYTHQGASIGFHIGYFFIFMVGLLIYNLGVTPAPWLELAAIAFPVFVGHASARLVPYNLLLAYERLSLRGGAIFFVFFLLGPVWAYFFLETYDLLLARALGVFVFLLAISIIAGQTMWQNRRKDKAAEHENNNSEE